MLSKLITYRLLLRVAGILLLLWALYIALQIATLQTYVGDSYVGLQIQYSFRLTILFIRQTGVPLLAAVAVLLLGFSFRHPTIAYWSVQLAIWLAGISLWYRFNYIFNPLPQNPLWLIVTVLCSMLMFVLYKPVMGLIRKLVPPKSKKPNINPKDEPYSSSQYEQPQVMYPKQD